MICSPPVLAELPTTEMSLEWRARKVAIGLADARGTIVYADVNKLPHTDNLPTRACKQNI